LPIRLLALATTNVSLDEAIEAASRLPIGSSIHQRFRELGIFVAARTSLRALSLISPRYLDRKSHR